jgi:alpha-methylacyl-CoA racemase
MLFSRPKRENIMLNQVKVLDLSRLLPGPACTWYLKEMGAQVDCVEPITGSTTRAYAPYIDGVGIFFTAHHRGKRSIVVDFYQQEGIELIKSLVKHYDVLVEGFKPGTLENMGLAPEILWEINENLIIARLSGYGQTGPWRQVPGHDLNYMSLAGGLNAQVTTEKGLFIPNMQMGDMAGALTGAMSICAALFARTLGKKKQVLDISLTESALTLNAHQITALSFEHQEPKVQDEFLTGKFPSYRTYQCLDGKWISIAGLEPKFMLKLQAQLGDDTSLWKDQIAQKEQSEWLILLQDCCVAPILSYEELKHHEQHQYRKAVVEEHGATWIRSAIRQGEMGPIPQLGEHTLAILRENGLDATQIDQLLKQKTIIQAKES